MRAWTLRAAFALVVLTALAWGAGEVAEQRAREGLRIQAQTAAALHEAVLRSELEKHRSLPFVLAEDPDVRALLDRRSPADVAALNRKLEALGERTRAAVIYIVAPDGVTLAASNWRLPSTFVGSNYGFRPYFRDALRTGTSEYFALGTVSGRPGLFLARRVETAGAPAGVVVVKVEFDTLEAEWRRSGDPAYVTDRNGVVLVTSIPEWRFRTQQALTPKQLADMRRTLQFGGGPFGALPLRPTSKPGEIAAQLPNRPEAKFAAARTGAAASGWTLHLLTPTAPVLTTAITAAQAVALILGALVLAALGLLTRRRELEIGRAAAREAARVELEHQVRARTAELRDTNERLHVEIEERRRAEASLHTLQDELVQANKLAMLGQIAAGVAHEINQPVAAIRTYADNAATFLDRDQRQSARKNLTVIASLTERIGVITDELRAFSRKAAGGAEAVEAEAAIAGALLLVGPSIRARRVRLVREGKTPGVRVRAERIRLEQVLVNLLQNALDAVGDRPAPLVTLGIESGPSEVRILIGDNGPGLSPAARAGLFTPFNTTKPTGVGLGLVISRDIMRDFGGQLIAAPDSASGATFIVVLRREA